MPAVKTPAAKAAAVKTATRKPAKPVAPVAVKVVAKKAPPPAAKADAAAKPPKLKARLVRDSFTMPQADFDLIAALKARAIEFKRPAKKSELLRAGLQALSGLNDSALRAALDALAPLKPGRPKKDA